MYRFLLGCALLLLTINIPGVFTIGPEKMLGPGRYFVYSISRCPDSDFPWEFSLTKQRFDRTKECYNVNISLPLTMDDSLCIKLDACKEMQGGCKPYQKMSDGVCRFMHKYAEDNLKNILEQAGVDPPDCPVPAGDYSIEKYILNYEDLPEDGIYGHFNVKIMLFNPKDGSPCPSDIDTEDKNMEKLACINAVIDFKEIED